MSATGLSRAEIVINISKQKSPQQQSEQQATQLDIWKAKGRAPDRGWGPSEGRPERGESPAGLVAAVIARAARDFNMCCFSAPGDGPWMGPASLEGGVHWVEVKVPKVIFPIGSS